MRGKCFKGGLVMHTFDVIVIGSGPAGSSIAAICNQKGMKTAIIEAEKYGGTCPLHGCIPKKVLAQYASEKDRLDRMRPHGLSNTGAINWQDLMAFKRTFTEPAPTAKEDDLRDQGIKTFYGTAHFTSKNKLQVNDKELMAEHIVIATGATPAPLPISGKEYLTYSDGFLDLDELPNEIAFIGGGYVSFELAHIAASAGSKVHIIQRGNLPLKGFDPDLVEKLVQVTEMKGIKVHVGCAAEAIEKKNDRLLVTMKKDNTLLTLDADMVVHGAGRIPNLDGLALEKGAVNYDKNGINVDENLKSISNPHVFAAGDVANTEGMPLTPVAGMEARLLGQYLTGESTETLDYTGVPSVVFTSPKVASVGMSVGVAEENSQQIDVITHDLTDWFTYKVTDEETAFSKVLVHRNTGQIVGAHILGEYADALIQYFALAIQLRLTKEQLRKAVYVFPTAISDISSMLEE